MNDSEEWSRYPAPIASAMAELVSETELHGLETTADETAAAIEALLVHLGRLWVAEYLRAVDCEAVGSSDQIQRDLVEGMCSGRPTHIGAWVSLSRRIREHLSGRETVLSNLHAVDFGELGDADHPVGQLIRFRNEFSHGSFHTTVGEIRRHRELLEDLLVRLPCLADQPAICRDAETGAILAATGHWPATEAPADARIPEGHPVIVGSEGRQLNLYPLLSVELADEGRRLAGFTTEKPARVLLEHPALAVWSERYSRERDGFLTYSRHGSPVELPASAASALRARLERERPGLVLVVGHPGCGAAGAVEALNADDPLRLGLDRYAAVGRVAVRQGDVGQSGLSFARFVLRLVERALGQAEGAVSCGQNDVLAADGPFRGALRELSASGKRVLVGLHDLHVGRVSYRGENLTVLEVYEALADSSVDVVATAFPDESGRTLFDERIAVPVGDAPDAAEVAQSVRSLCSEQPLRMSVLTALAASGQPMGLFDLCDELERHGGTPVFEPEVERALWDLRPLLEVQRSAPSPDADGQEGARAWRIFSPAVAGALAAGAAGEA